MRDANKALIVLIAAAALAACGKPASEYNVASDNQAATPTDIDTLPPDESSATPSDELANGADSPAVNGATSVATNNSD
jgi:predicted small lipoprotein YifL